MIGNSDLDRLLANEARRSSAELARELSEARVKDVITAKGFIEHVEARICDENIVLELIKHRTIL